MTLKSKLLLRLALIALYMLSSQRTLADLPASLKPIPDIPVVNVGSTANFFCTDRIGAEKIAVAFRENVDCHEQLKSGGIDFVLIGEAILAGIAAGIVIDKTLLRSY